MDSVFYNYFKNENDKEEDEEELLEEQEETSKLTELEEENPEPKQETPEETTSNSDTMNREEIYRRLSEYKNQNSDNEAEEEEQQTPSNSLSSINIFNLKKSYTEYQSHNEEEESEENETPYTKTEEKTRSPLIASFGQPGENLDATGRMIRDEEENKEETTIPLPTRKPKRTSLLEEDPMAIIPEKKPVVPEIKKYTFDLQEAPIVNLGEDRIKSLLNNTKAKFEIKNELPSGGTFYEQSKRFYKKTTRNVGLAIGRDNNLAAHQLEEHDNIIVKMSEKHGVDPNLVRAVMWTENSTGSHLGLNEIADNAGISKSQMPMNIRGDIWAPIIGKKPGALNNPEENIEASVILLKRINDRIEEPNAAKIGSIWNVTGRENINLVGQEIGKIYEQKPWINRK